MFVVMNRFKVIPGCETEFESRWLDREVQLRTVPGFIKIQFMKGETAQDHVLYASQTFWADKKDFDNWRSSMLFETTHKNAGKSKILTLEKRQSNSFTILKTVDALEPVS